MSHDQEDGSGVGKPQAGPALPARGAVAYQRSDMLRMWGRGISGETGTRVAIPGGATPGQAVRVIDWTCPLLVDVPIVVRVALVHPTEVATPAPWASIRGAIEYASGATKYREEIGFPANGFMWRGSVREFTMELRRELAPFIPDALHLIASIAQESNVYQRWRQGPTFIVEGGEAPLIVPTFQLIPQCVTRYRASVVPFGVVADIEFAGPDAGSGVLDTVPALAVLDWQTLPIQFARWRQDAASIAGGTSAVTMEFE